MSDEEFTRLQEFCEGLFRGASKDAPVVVERLRQAQSLVGAVKEYLTKAADVAPGPEMRQRVIDPTIEHSQALVSALDKTREALIELIQTTAAAVTPQERIVALLREISAREQTPANADVARRALALGQEGTVLRCVAQFGMASGVFTFTTLFAAYNDAANALKGEHSDLLLKSEEVAKASATAGGEILADLASGGTYAFIKGFLEVYKASQVNNLKVFVDSIRKADGLERVLAFDRMQGTLREHNDFSKQIITHGINEIRKLTLSVHEAITGLAQ
jgi:hypothetical protein